MERCVDRQVARLLVSPAEYALAERLHEGNPVGIAEDLGVPVWVVEAYQQALHDEFVSAHYLKETRLWTTPALPPSIHSS